jgi:hypothetical protein
VPLKSIGHRNTGIGPKVEEEPMTMTRAQEEQQQVMARAQENRQCKQEKKKFSKE